MDIEIIALEASQVDTDNNEPWHFRGAYDFKNDEIRLPIFDKSSEEQKVIIITEASTMLGHPKREGCCNATPDLLRSLQDTQKYMMEMHNLVYPPSDDLIPHTCPVCIHVFEQGVEAITKANKQL